MSAETLPELTTDPGRKVGVLFVHGMGVQSEGDTLTYMGDPLLNWASAWLVGHKVKAEIVPCQCAPAANQPKHVHALWTAKDEGEQADRRVDLILAEAWWSELFNAPSASRIANWLPPLVSGVMSQVLCAIGLVVVLVTLGISAISNEDPAAAFTLGVSLAISLFILIAILPSALLLLGKIPGPLGGASAAFLSFLTLWVGDVLLYQQSPRDAYAAQEKIRANLAWLTDTRDEAIVAAHSLGSMLSIDALVVAQDPKVKFFVSFGCPIRVLKKQQDHYNRQLHALYSGCPDMGWVNFHDPLDIIGGPVAYKASFPLNVKIDNGCSILGAHGGYPDNLEQFQDALYRLVIFNDHSVLGTVGTAPTEPRGLHPHAGFPSSIDRLANDGRRTPNMLPSPRAWDDAVAAAFRSRWWRFFNGTAFMMLSLPAAMAGAYLLYRVGWAGFITSTAQNQKFVPDPLKEVLHDAALEGSGEQEHAGSLLICLSNTAVLAAVLLWIGHLVLFNYRARAQAKLAAGMKDNSWRTGFRLLLTALWALWLMTIIVGTWAAIIEHGLAGLALVGWPAVAAATIGIWTFTVGIVRHRRVKLEQGPAGNERLEAAEALGAPYFCIEHSCSKHLTHPAPPVPAMGTTRAGQGAWRLQPPRELGVLSARPLRQLMLRKTRSAQEASDRERRGQGEGAPNNDSDGGSEPWAATDPGAEPSGEGQCAKD